MMNSEADFDHKDPFNGGRKASLAGLVYFCQLCCWLSLAPFLPVFIYYTYNMGYYYP